MLEKGGKAAKEVIWSYDVQVRSAHLSAGKALVKDRKLVKDWWQDLQDLSS